MKGRSPRYQELREYCRAQPIVDCHDHSGECGPKVADPIQVVAGGYFTSDVRHFLTPEEDARLFDGSVPWGDRWPLFEKAWRQTCHTGYAQVTRRVLDKFYGIKEVTLDALRSMEGRLPDYTDPAAYEAVLEDAGILARVADIWPDHRKVLDGTLPLPPRARLAISLPGLHSIRDHANVQGIASAVGRIVTTLDEYLDVCREILEGHKRFGAVTCKDQSAYNRSLDYANPTRAEAEAVFNRFMEDPRRSAGFPDESRPLDDYLFHAFCRMAAELDLPVQIHTGHMAGIRNDIAKTNAVHLTRVLELHQDVRFDLFHANWPYGEELLFLGKNYPNVHLDFCWANIIDPLYCQDLLKKVLSSVPHGKVHGFGADFGPDPERSWAHADIARDNIAIALSDLIDLDYIDLDDARQIARMWLFENPNAFFRLGLEA